MPKMTDSEIKMMGDSTTEDEWNANCDKVRAAHGGDYPEDWYMIVVASGLAARTSAKFGKDDKIHII